MRVALPKDCLRRTRSWSALAAAAALAACAGVDVPTASDCPQPRFTGQAPAQVFNLGNPRPTNDRELAAGRRLFEGGADPGCHLCHGMDGGGHGPMSAQFEPPPRNFACARTVNGIPDGQLYWIIKNGSPGTAMPSFGHLRDAQIWQLVMYLRQLAQ